MKNFTMDDLRALLDEVGVPYWKNRDAFSTVASVDENTLYPARLVWKLEGEDAALALRCVALSEGDKVRVAPSDYEEALEFCNEWNSTLMAPHAFFGEDVGDFILDYTVYNPASVDASYIKEYAFELFRGGSLTFFEDAGRKFVSKNR